MIYVKNLLKNWRPYSILVIVLFASIGIFYLNQQNTKEKLLRSEASTSLDCSSCTNKACIGLPCGNGKFCVSNGNALTLSCTNTCPTNFFGNSAGMSYVKIAPDGTYTGYQANLNETYFKKELFHSRELKKRGGRKLSRRLRLPPKKYR